MGSVGWGKTEGLACRIVSSLLLESYLTCKYVMFIIQVFNHLFFLQLEEDVNEVIFALSSETCIEEDCFTEAAGQLEKLFKIKHPEINQSVLNTTKKIRRLK